LGGCSIKKMALKGMAGTFAQSGKVYASDDDPELIRDATPFALKTIETLLADLPEHRGLLLSACQGFTQYGYAFVQVDAAYVEEEDWEEAERLRDRALRLYLRALDYGLRGLELDYPGISETLRTDPETAVREAKAEHIDMLFWTGASWGAAISLGKDRPDILADLPAVSALMTRCLELDETYGRGAVHEVLVSLEALPANMGGSLDRARAHFARALELNEGKRVGTYVTLAESVSIQTQDREEFASLLGRALEIDPYAEPEARLQNLVARKRAEFLLEHADDYFLEGAPEDEESQ